MNLLDLLIIAFAVFAVLGGYRLGFLARATSWAGLALGLILAVHFLPDIVNSLRNSAPNDRLLIVAATFIGAAFVGQALGLLVGAAIHRRLPLGPLRQVDRVIGAVAGLVGVSIAVWLLLPSMADVPGWSSREARNSTIARAVDSFFPPPRDTLQALRRLVGSNDFPRVFDALRPAENTGAPPGAIPLAPAVRDRVAASTVKVEGVACHFTVPEKGGFKGWLGLAEQVSDISLACRQIGPIHFKGKMEQGDDMFRQRRSLFFKKMQIVRGCDAKRNVLVYMVYSDKLIEGSPKNSTSSVPIMPWGAGDTAIQKCGEFIQ